MAPLVLSVRRPTELASPRQNSGARKGSCQFCATEAKPQEPFSCLDGDGACSFCHLVGHLDHPNIDAEAVLIWLPELTQAALIAIVHECHRRLAKHGMQHFAPLARSAVGNESIPIEVREALAAIAAFRGRVDEVEARLGSSSPQVLAQALLLVNAQTYAERARRLHGVRLMPLGRSARLSARTFS